MRRSTNSTCHWSSKPYIVNTLYIARTFKHIPTHFYTLVKAQNIHLVGVNPRDTLTPDNFFNVTFPHEHDPLSHYGVSGNAPPLNPVERL